MDLHTLHFQPMQDVDRKDGSVRYYMRIWVHCVCGVKHTGSVWDQPDMAGNRYPAEMIEIVTPCGVSLGYVYDREHCALHWQ